MKHPEYGHHYNPEDVELPVNFLPQHPFDNGELKIRDEVLLPFPRTEAMMKKDLADYYGMISEVDTQIGRIMNTLREKGELENTIIVLLPIMVWLSVVMGFWVSRIYMNIVSVSPWQ